jgi:hypothetical protein
MTSSPLPPHPPTIYGIDSFTTNTTLARINTIACFQNTSDKRAINSTFFLPFVFFPSIFRFYFFKFYQAFGFGGGGGGGGWTPEGG